MSFACILGGLLTQIGTSTNLIMSGLVEESFPNDPELYPGFWEIGQVGAPMAAFGIAYCVALRGLLPVRTSPATTISENSRRYVASVKVPVNSPAVGKTIAHAGLRRLEDLFLVEILRANGDLIAAPASTTRVEAGDQLSFAGDKVPSLNLSQASVYVFQQLLDKLCRLY